ncbi:cytosolic thiouridylase subunit Ctu1, partial [Coemansia sp. RSA 1285]
PFKYAYEKEIVMYAYLKRLDYFSTECTYSPNAYRGYAREFLKDLESVRSTAILDIIHSGEAMRVASSVQLPTPAQCERCGYLSSNALCKACVLLEGLERGLPKLGIDRSARQAQQIIAADSANADPVVRAVEPVHFERLRQKALAMRERRLNGSDTAHPQSSACAGCADSCCNPDSNDSDKDVCACMSDTTA